MEIVADIPLVTCGDLFSANLLLISQLTAEKSCCNGWVFWVSPNRELPEMSQLFRLVNHNPRFIIYSNYWWLVGDLEHFFPYIGNNHTNWLIFSEGLKPPTRQFVIYSIDEYCYRSWCEIWLKNQLIQLIIAWSWSSCLSHSIAIGLLFNSHSTAIKIAIKSSNRHRNGHSTAISKPPSVRSPAPAAPKAVPARTALRIPRRRFPWRSTSHDTPKVPWLGGSKWMQPWFIG